MKTVLVLIMIQLSQSWISKIIPNSVILKKLTAQTASLLVLSTLAINPNVLAVNPEIIDVRRVNEEDSKNNADRAVVKLPDGVQYFDVKVGDGATADEGKSVQFQWVLRRSNGYFVDSSANYDNEPFVYRVGNTKKVIKGHYVNVKMSFF